MLGQPADDATYLYYRDRKEEYQTVDPVTRDLRSHIHTEMMEQGKRDAPPGTGEGGDA